MKQLVSIVVVVALIVRGGLAGSQPVALDAADAGVSASAPTTTAPPRREDEGTPTEDAPDPGHRQRATSLGLAIAGGVSLTIAGFSRLFGSMADYYDHHCLFPPCGTEPVSDVYNTVAIVGASFGAVSLIAGLIVRLTAPSTAGAGIGWGLSVGPTQGGAQLGVGARF